MLPPVGDAIELGGVDDTEAVLEAVFAGYDVRFFASGTMALAAAMTIGLEERVRSLTREGLVPEVVVPAYACPDLVSAAEFAGCRPVPVDLEEGRPWMDPEALARSLRRQTIAVVAVDFLGIQERIDRIRSIIGDRRIRLIEDSAQRFPIAPAVEGGAWSGDFVVLSFGRGKPVNLLGGGALLRDRSRALVDDRAIEATGPSWERAGETVSAEIAWRLRALLYNRVLDPVLYGIVAALPFLHVGETRYEPLERIEALGGDRLRRRLAANVERYIGRNRSPQSRIRAMLDEIGAPDVDLPGRCRHDASAPLLRYPIVLPTPAIRDGVLERMREAGLGASGLYPAVLTEICPWIEGDEGGLPHARAFAGTVMTLPVHAAVEPHHIEAMADVLRSFLVDRAA